MDEPALGIPRFADVQIAEVLRGVARGEIEIAGWRHPLGFIHVRVRMESPWKVRLHLWPERMDPTRLGYADRIHNHSFDFVSHVLRGVVLERRYFVQPDPDGDLTCLAVEHAEGRSSLRATGQRFVTSSTNDVQHAAGEHYDMRAGLFHDAMPVDNDTATLVLARPQPGVPSLVLARRGHLTAEQPWSEVDVSTLRGLAAKLSEARGDT